MTAPPLAPQIILEMTSPAWLCSCVLTRLPNARINKATRAKRRRSTLAMNRAQTPQAMAIAMSSAEKIAPIALSGRPSWSIKAPPRIGWICSVPREMTIIRQMAPSDFLLSMESSAFMKHHLR